MPTPNTLFVEFSGWPALSCVAELVKSYDSPSFSKVLTTSATKLATKLHEVPTKRKEIMLLVAMGYRFTRIRNRMKRWKL